MLKLIFHQKKINPFCTILLLLLFLFPSCKNFLTGANLIEELDEAIDYANAPEYIISVANTNIAWGNITAGAGDHIKKVTDNIDLNFFINDGYKFIKWDAVNKYDNSVSMNDYIHFSDQTNLSTSAKIIEGSNDILITPVCAQIFAVTNTSIDSPDTTYNRDTPIIINFNQDLAESTDEINNINNISINISGIINSKDYFNNPIIDKNRIIINCNPENLIPVNEDSTRTVTITIPADFCYFYDNIKMCLTNKYTLTYTIDSSTTEKTSIQFSPEQSGDTNGIFTVDGITANGSKSNYSIGQIIHLTYKGTGDYIFSGFVSSAENVVLISKPEYDETTNVWTSTVTVLKGGKDICITPFTTIRNKLTLRFEATNGNLIPFETKSFFENESFDLKFTENTGFCFSHFELLDSDNESVEIDDYLQIDKSKTEQKVTVKKVDAALTLKVIGEERPQVKFILPANGKEGLVRNASIKILFSQPMNVDDLKNTSLIKVTQGILRSTSQEIAIDAQDASNILQYEVNGKGDLLSITLTDDNLFQINAYINVKISKDVRNDNNIPFASDYDFQFQVSNNIDSLAPIINKLYVGVNDYKDEIKIKKYPMGTDRLIENTITGINKGMEYEDNSKILDKIITKGQKLKFYVQAGDLIGFKETKNTEQSESDVARIGYKITQVVSFDSKGDHSLTNGFSYENYFDYSGNGGDLKGKQIGGQGDVISNGTTFTLDLTNLDGNGKQAPDGILRIDVYAIDKNDNNGYDEQYWSTHENGYHTFFVTKDSNAPKITTAKWYKHTLIEEEIKNAARYYVKNDSYIKFNIEEEMTGISSFEIKCENSSKISKNRAEDEDVIIIYNPTSDDIFKGEVISKITRSADSIIFSSNSTYTENFKTQFSGWYYILGLVDNDITEGKYSLKIILKDGAGNKTEVESPLYVDKTAPILKGSELGYKNAPGPVVEQYTFADGNNAENVFPRVGNPGLTGQDFRDRPNIPNGDGNEVRWFYTNSWNNTNEWGVFLKQEFTKSNISQDAPAKIVYQKNSDGTLSDAELKNITASNIYKNPTKTFTLTSADAFTNYFGIGTHSFVLMSDSGYISPAYTFVVVKDDKGPVIKTSDNRDIRYLITYDFPDYNSYTGLGSIGQHMTASSSSPQFDWCSKDKNGKLDSFRGRTYNFKCNTIADCLKNKFIIRLSGSYDSDNNKNKNIYEKDGNPTYHNNGEYWQEAWPSRTSSGISQYYVCRVYSSWRRQSKGHFDDPFIPALPPDTNTNARFLDDIIHEYENCTVDYNNATGNKNSSSSSIKYDTKYSTLNNYFDDWKAYTTGTDIEITPFVKDCFQPGILNEDYKYRYYMAPITLFFKDNCGNIDYMILTVPNWAEYATFAFRFDVKDIN